MYTTVVFRTFVAGNMGISSSFTRGKCIAGADAAAAGRTLAKKVEAEEEEEEEDEKADSHRAAAAASWPSRPAF